MSLPDLYNTQISMHEWFERINHKDAEAVRDEDYGRQARLEKLYNTTGLPFDKPEIFSPIDVFESSPNFLDYFEKNKKTKCRLRLVPLTKDVQKLRTVGRTVAESVNWLKEQNIDPLKYELHFFKFSDNTYWSTIFIVNSYGIFGEIIYGGHSQLTQGFYESESPITFKYDYTDLTLNKDIETAYDHLRKIIAYLKVDDIQTQDKLKEILNATFSKGYLNGYFETVSADNVSLEFLDYNRVLGQIYQDLYLNTIGTQESALVTGQTGCVGLARGTVRIIAPEDVASTQLEAHEILVCDMTNPLYIPLMMQSAGIITDRGGILSHAAIVSRELGKPCIVGTGNATKVLKDGQEIEMDAEKGIVK